MAAREWLRREAPAAVVVAVVMGGIGFAPLFGGPGYEAALAMGLIVPGVAAVASSVLAFETRRRSVVALAGVGEPWREEARAPTHAAAVVDGIERALWLSLSAFATMVLHGGRVGFCSFAGGSLLVLMGPVPGVILGGAWGGFSGAWLAERAIAWPRRRALAAVVALALAAPLATVLASVVRFVTSPMVFAFDPFVGFFSGTLYDTVIDGTEKLLSYRLGTLAWVTTLLFVARIRAGDRRRWTVALAVISASIALGVHAAGSQLGHWQTVATTRRELGGETPSERCLVVHPRGMRPEAAALMGRDCDQDVAAVERYLGVSGTPRITVFLFQDAAQKRALMGAADVYVAKPWRHEVYIQYAGFGGYPHPVLRHELAHVIAGEFGRGPFRIAGSLGGLVPDPGLIEGIAEAASPDDDELSLEEWSRAMLDLGSLPELRQLFGTGFLGVNQSRAYTVAGAFVTWFHREYGAASLRRWYGGEAVETVTGKAWGELENAFRDHLRVLSFPPEALAIAKARFERPAVFGRHCPHEVDATRRRASQMLGAGDFRGARELVDQVEHDAPEPATWLLRATCRERAGDVSGAMDELTRVTAIPNVARTSRDRADERLADLALASGDLADAAHRYTALRDRSIDEDVLRTLDVKLLATSDANARDAVLPLLIGRPETGASGVEGAEETGRWVEREPDNGVPRYLLARSAVSRGDWARAAILLDEAMSRTVAQPRIRREAARIRVIAGCVLKDAAAITRGLEAWTREGDPPGSRGELLRALAGRCMGEGG